MQKYLALLSSGRCSDGFDSSGRQQVWGVRDDAAHCNALGAVITVIPLSDLQDLSIGIIISWDANVDQEMMYLKIREHPHTLRFPGWM